MTVTEHEGGDVRTRHASDTRMVAPTMRLLAAHVEPGRDGFLRARVDDNRKDQT
jgi:hypothetical protein